MSEYSSFSKLITALENIKIQSILNDSRIKHHEFQKNFQKMQFYITKIRLLPEKTLDEETKGKIRKYIIKLISLESKIFKLISTGLEVDQNYSLYIPIYSSLATLFEYCYNMFLDVNYIIYSIICYSISEFEPNSTALFNKIITKNSDLSELINFDYKENSNVTEIDIIIIMFILVFARQYSLLQNLIDRNIDFFSENPVLKYYSKFFDKFLNLILNNKKIDDLDLILGKLKVHSLEIGNPILIWITTRFQHHIKKMLKKSIWQIPKKLPHIPEKYFKILIQNGIYEVWSSQYDWLEEYSQNWQNSIVSMPTSSGKTLIAELSAINEIFNQNQKVLYIAPTNALVNQIYNDHILSFKKMRLNILRMSGNYEKVPKIDHILFNHSSLIIMTPEKLDSFLRKKGMNFILYFSMIIWDEFQLINDESRGLKYELLISKVKRFCQIEERNIKHLIMSASLPKSSIKILQEWFDPKSTMQVYSEWKPTRMIEGILFNEMNDPKNHGIIFPGLNKKITDFERKNFPNSYSRIYFYTKFLTSYFPLLIFCANKPITEKIIDHFYENQHSYFLKKNIHDSKFLILLDIIIKEIGENHPLVQYLRIGLAYHHAGLPNTVKEIIEIMIKKNYINICASTTTFAQGVDFPIQSIIFHSFYLFQNNRMKILSYNRYINIIGRVSRSKKFTEGLILICCKNEQNYVKISNCISTGSLEKLRSQFNLINSQSLELNSINPDLIKDLQIDLLSHDITKLKLKQFFSSTFHFYENNKSFNPTINMIIENEIQKIQEFRYPENMKSTFNQSGFSLPFCIDLYNFITNNNLYSKSIKIRRNKKSILDTFDKINHFIFTNHFKFNDLNIDELQYLTKKWIFREDLNFQFLSENSVEMNEINRLINLINTKIVIYLPWIWTLVVKIFINFDPNCSKNIRFIPYYLKFGVCEEKSLVNALYILYKDILIGKEKISKEFISDSISKELRHNDKI